MTLASTISCLKRGLLDLVSRSDPLPEGIKLPCTNVVLTNETTMGCLKNSGVIRTNLPWEFDQTLLFEVKGRLRETRRLCKRKK